MFALTLSCIALIIGSLVPCLATFLPTDDEALLGMVKHALLTVSKPVPGDSPAVYVGDPANDLLVIDSLDLIPNPPIGEEDFTILLTGHLTTPIDVHASFKLTTYLNGTLGSSLHENLYDGADMVEVWQDGKRARDGLARGPVQMRYRKCIPYPWMEMGFYKVRMGMWNGDGRRMTGFEGTVWVEGKEGAGG